MGIGREVAVHWPRAVWRWLAAAPLGVTIVGLLFVAMGRLDETWVWPLFVDPVVFASVFWLWVRRRNPWPKVVPARLGAGSEGVTIDGVLALERRRIRRAYVQPWRDGNPTVRILGRFGRPLLEVKVADEAEGRAILDALELGVAHSAARFNGASPVYATTARRIGLMVGICLVTFAAAALIKIGHLGSPFVNVVFVFPALVALLTAVPSGIHVGADGVLVTWLWNQRYYRFADIAGVVAHGGAARLWLHSGEAIDVLVVARRALGRINATDRMRLDALVARIQAALEGARSGRRPTEVAALVSRGGRTAEEWAEALRGLLARAAGDYRASAVPEENLWRVAEDATAEETARVGAAVALRAGLDADGRARMLRVAEASVSPRVRVALRAAAGEEEAALVEALAAYEAESAATA
jgi:hypothetical protein